MKFATAAVFATLLTALVAGVGSGTISVAAQEKTEASPATPERTRQDMMAMRKKMMAEEQAANVRLQGLLDQMASAQGDARIDAMRALLTELTEQKIAHQQQMGQMMGMMEKMMGGMGGGRGAAPAER